MLLSEYGELMLINELNRMYKHSHSLAVTLNDRNRLTISKVLSRRKFLHSGHTPSNSSPSTRTTTPSAFSGEISAFSNTTTTSGHYATRYLDPRTSRWLSVDPAMYQGDYIPFAPNSVEARRYNQNLPGLGGIFNAVNMHVYHYGGNNPVIYRDPDGRNFFNTGDKHVIIKPETGNDFIFVRPGQMYEGRIDGAIIVETGAIIKVTSGERGLSAQAGLTTDSSGNDLAFLVGPGSILVNFGGDFIKSISDNNELPSGVYSPEVVKGLPELMNWIDQLLEASAEGRIITDSTSVRDMTLSDYEHIFSTIFVFPLENRD